jgi:RNA polymerase sigma-70 factor
MPRGIEAIAKRLYQRAGAERWTLPLDVFAEALEASARKAFSGNLPEAAELERYLQSLHLEDLALASACAAGIDAAWEQFILQQRPALYRSADAIDPGGAAREVADSLYAELYGINERGKERASLFRYFHGRSSLTTWLRAVLAQRYVDRVRVARRLEPLPEEEAPLVAPAAEPNPDWERYADLLKRALARAIAGLSPRDRLRIGCYYAEAMTLAAIGRMLSEHEATVSRHLSRTRRALKEQIESFLRVEHRLSDAEIAECFSSAADHAGAMDLKSMFARSAQPDRST